MPCVAGEMLVPVLYELGENAELEDLRIEVALRCHFRVEVSGEDLDDLGIEVLDASGETLQIRSFNPTGSISHAHKMLVDGKMEVAAISEDGLWLVLFRGSRELVRRELALVPGEVRELRIDLED